MTENGQARDAFEEAACGLLLLDAKGRIELANRLMGVWTATTGETFILLRVDEYQRLVATNLTGFLHVTQPALRQMKAQGSGHIVTITTSLASFVWRTATACKLL